MKTNIRYWQSVLQEAERELEAATGNITLKAAAKRYMRAKAELKRLEEAKSGPLGAPNRWSSARIIISARISFV